MGELLGRGTSGTVVLSFKKGCKLKPIGRSYFCVPFMFSKAITNRPVTRVDQFQPSEQASFQ